MAPFYHRFAQPVGWLAFRIVIGGLLTVEGCPRSSRPRRAERTAIPLSGGPDDVANAPRTSTPLIAAVTAAAAAVHQPLIANGC
jgi:hypothetical protein